MVFFVARAKLSAEFTWANAVYLNSVAMFTFRSEIVTIPFRFWLHYLLFGRRKWTMSRQDSTGKHIHEWNWLLCERLSHADVRMHCQILTYALIFALVLVSLHSKTPSRIITVIQIPLNVGMFQVNYWLYCWVPNTANMINNNLTSTIAVREIRKTPNVSESDAVSQSRENEFGLTAPLFPLIYVNIGARVCKIIFPFVAVA